MCNILFTFIYYYVTNIHFDIWVFNFAYMHLYLLCSGASGPISFGTPSAGDRSAGLAYEVAIFDGAAYQTDSSSDAFAYIGSWTTESGYQHCAGDCVVTEVYNNIVNDAEPPHQRGPYADDDSVIKIAAFFDIFDADGNANSKSAQRLAAFLMAIRDLNDKSDGIYDDLLPNKKLVFSLHYPAAEPYGAIESAVEASLHADFGQTGESAYISKFSPFEHPFVI
jgi:hypothetical protein